MGSHTPCASVRSISTPARMAQLPLTTGFRCIFNLCRVDSKRFYARGKLLLTGEYAVLDGALALGLPTQMGQSLRYFSYSEPGILRWESHTSKGLSWFKADFRTVDFSIVRTTDRPTALRLQQILTKIRLRNPSFLPSGAAVCTRLEFPLEWGLGSSSTLVSNLAAWAQVDPFWLQAETLGGSGCYIACAQCDKPVLFHRENGIPLFREVDFRPPFADRLYFVHLNRKQSTRSGIAAYRKKAHGGKWVEMLTELTRAVIQARDLSAFEGFLTEHERALSRVLNQPPIKAVRFADYPHAVKSLGAWGGDFVLAVGDEAAPAYFSKKGFETVVPYRQMIC